MKFVASSILCAIVTLSFPFLAVAGMCGDDSSPKEVVGTFKVAAVRKAKVECSFDQNMDVLNKPAWARIQACVADLVDTKTGKAHTALGGKAACKLKVGQKTQQTIMYRCCGAEVAVTCDMRGTPKVKSPGLADDYNWFCSSNVDAFIKGTLSHD